MLNFVLCDDNLNTLNRQSNMFNSIFTKHDLDAKIAFKTNNPSELLSYIKENPINVLVLDINLHAEISGIQIAKQIREKNKDCYIIFITCHCEYVFLAYKYKVFDYLCKPVSQESLEDTVLRLFKDIQESKSNKKYIKLDHKNTIIDQKEVLYIKRDGMKVIFHTEDKDYETYNSFTKLQEHLPSNFVRCHKSYIANINNIAKLEPSENLIYFEHGCSCDIGPKYKNNLLKEVKIYGNF